MDINIWVVHSHLAEELNEMLDGKELVSLSSFPKADIKKINDQIIEEEKRVEKTISEIRNVMKMSGVENPKKITLFISESWHYDFFKELKNEIEIKQNRNVKELIIFQDKYQIQKTVVKNNLQLKSYYFCSRLSK